MNMMRNVCAGSLLAKHPRVFRALFFSHILPPSHSKSLFFGAETSRDSSSWMFCWLCFVAHTKRVKERGLKTIEINSGTCFMLCFICLRLLVELSLSCCWTAQLSPRLARSDLHFILWREREELGCLFAKMNQLASIHTLDREKKWSKKLFMMLLQNGNKYLPSRRVLFGFYLSHYANYSPPPSPKAHRISLIEMENGKMVE